MENYFGLFEAAFAVMVLIGIGVVELVSRRIDRKYRRAADMDERKEQ